MVLQSRFAPVALSFAIAIGGLATSGAAQAQVNYRYFQGGVSTGLMATQNASDHMGSLGWMLGYRFNKDWGVQAIGFGATSPFYSRYVTGDTPVYDFTRFVGAQGIGYINATSAWDIFGTLGAGRASYGSYAPDAGVQTKTDGIVGAGLRWQVVPHVALSASFSRLFNAQATDGALRAEFNF